MATAALTGPADGTVIDKSGAVLSCGQSENAVNYQLVFGPDPESLTTIISETANPPAGVIREFPFNPTFWTVKVFDAFGTSVHPDPRCLYTSEESDYPIVTGLQPQDGSVVKGTVALQVRARDSRGIAKVKFFVNGRLHHTSFSPPFSCTWDTNAQPQREHILRATAYNRLGRQSSVQSRVTVANMSLTLRGERKLERAWLLKKPYARLAVSVDNPDSRVPVHTLLIYRMDPGGAFSLLADAPIPSIQGQEFPFIDPTIPSNRTVVYKVEARDENARILARSNFLII